MTTYRQNIVLDANVAIAAIHVHPLSDKAIALFDLLIDNFHHGYVTDLFFAEVTSTLTFLSRHPRVRLDRTLVLQHLDDLVKMPFSVTACKQLTPSAAVIAMTHKISGYDAMYVALAETIGAPLITADRKLLNSLAQSKHEIVWLGDAV
jgi:predicted nucleic acid-binding protein